MTGPPETQESNFFSASSTVVSWPWPGRTRVSSKQGQHVFADGGQLAGEVGELAVVRDRSLGQQGVPGEHRAEFLAVQAHRSGGMARRVNDLQLDVGDLEDPPSAISMSASSEG